MKRAVVALNCSDVAVLGGLFASREASKQFNGPKRTTASGEVAYVVRERVHAQTPATADACHRLQCCQSRSH